MKAPTILLMSLILFASACTAVHALSTVDFASGATSAERSGMLPSGPAQKQYARAGKAGQKLAVEIKNADVPIAISFTTPSNMTGFRSGHKFALDETGICVVTLSKTGETPSTDYNVVFTIQ